MTKKTWELDFDGRKHLIELDHGTMSGKREIRVDGQLKEKSRKLIDTGSEHLFVIDGHACIVHIKTNGVTFNYDLSRRPFGHHKESGGRKSDYARSI
jgi:hypothetical protein